MIVFLLSLLLSSTVLAQSPESANKTEASPQQQQGRKLDQEESSGRKMGQEVTNLEVNSNVLELRNSPEEPMMELGNPRQPYQNTYQRQQEPSYSSQPTQPHSYSKQGLNILTYAGEAKVRPTMESLNSYAASQGRDVTTPKELLDMCCQFPACYDPLYQLCIDTCRKCETVYPVTSWLPCPPLLNIPDCTSPNLSWMGSLPLPCYPDIGPFGNIIPLNSISAASKSYHSGPGSSPGRAGSINLAATEQSYRAAIRNQNRKQCSGSGICHSDFGQGWPNNQGY